jgi:hypothetical protein
LSNVTGAATRTSVLNDHGKHNPIAEVADFLRPELQVLVGGKPLLKEAANGRPSLEAVPQRPPLEGRIFGEAAGHRVEITTIRSVERPAHKLNQVGGLRLLGHRREYRAAADTLEGDGGNDKILDFEDADLVSGGNGKDFIDTRDHAADNVDGGFKTDTCGVDDPEDTVTGCETTTPPDGPKAARSYPIG